MVKEDLQRQQVYASLLKVVKPYEGTAFVVVADHKIGVYAVSCAHVVLRDNDDASEEHEVILEYCFKETFIRIDGRYLPDQSDPDHDVAVLKLNVPENLINDMHPLPLCRDFERGEEVIGAGFPEGQDVPRSVPAVLETYFAVGLVNFEDNNEGLEVLEFDTHGQGFGSWREHWFLRGMSGGPIWSNRTQAVIAVIEGRKARGDLGEAPQGYGIALEHLWRCSSTIRAHGIWKKKGEKLTLSLPRKDRQSWVDRFRTWVVTHKTAAVATLLLTAAFVYLLLSQLRPPPEPIDLLEKVQIGEAEIGSFGGVSCKLEDNRLVIDYALEPGYNGCYINFPFNTPVYRTLIINAEAITNQGGAVPKEFTIELKQGRQLDIVARDSIATSGQDVSRSIPRRGVVDQITIVFFPDKVGSPRGRISISRFVLSPR
ncbi:MAG: serine protease [Candidatus Hadarchaeum sp.]